MEYENIIKKKMKKINKYQEISTFLQLVTPRSTAYCFYLY